MELILIIGVLLLLISSGFILLEKPYYLVTLLIFMMIYVVNVQIPGPLDLRGLLLVVLFGRLIVFNRENHSLITNVLFKSPFFHMIFAFMFLTFIVTYSYEGSLKLIVKDQILSLVSLVMGFIILGSTKGRNAFIIGLIAAGFFSVFDIVFHYLMGGFMSEKLIVKETFTIVRILDYLTLKAEFWGVNHNFPGYLAGTAFIFVYLDHFRKSRSKKYTLPLMVLLGAGVLLSTSRSTLLAVILGITYINISHGNLNVNFKKVIISLIAVITVYISVYFLYNIFLKSSASEDSLIVKAYYRLYEDPIQYFSGGTKKYDSFLGTSQEDNLTFRLEKAQIDLDKFFSRELFIQLFGYGKGGYKYIGQKIFQDFNNSYILGAHNGYVLILIETGIIGILLFLIFSIGLIVKSTRVNKWMTLDCPVFYLFFMLMIYVTFQNGELTNSISFLFMGGMIANVYVFNLQTYVEEQIEIDKKNMHPVNSKL